jgi:hypothetical protein
MRPFRATSGEIADLAGRQHGVVTRSQLLALGMSDRAITRAAAAGRIDFIEACSPSAIAC